MAVGFEFYLTGTKIFYFALEAKALARGELAAT